MKFCKDCKEKIKKHGSPVARGIWTKGIHVMNNYRAKKFCKTQLDINEFFRTGKKMYTPTYGIILEDLGLHFGMSKHIYPIDGPSKIWGKHK